MKCTVTSQCRHQRVRIGASYAVALNGDKATADVEAEDFIDCVVSTCAGCRDNRLGYNLGTADNPAFIEDPFLVPVGEYLRLRYSPAQTWELRKQNEPGE